MKIVTASNGKQTVKMSKADWQSIGKKAGWLKKANFYDRPYFDPADAFTKEDRERASENPAVYSLATKMNGDFQFINYDGELCDDPHDLAEGDDKFVGVCENSCDEAEIKIDDLAKRIAKMHPEYRPFYIHDNYDGFKLLN